MKFFGTTARMHEKECQRRKVLRETKVTSDMVPDLLDALRQALDSGTNDCVDTIRNLYIISLKPNISKYLLVGDKGPTGLMELLAAVAVIDSGDCGQSGALSILTNLLRDKANFGTAIQAGIPERLMTIVKSPKHGRLRSRAVAILQRLSTDDSETVNALFRAGFTPALASHTKSVRNTAIARQSKRPVSTMKKAPVSSRADTRPIQARVDSALYA
jgi:hypothetical protein